MTPSTPGAATVATRGTIGTRRRWRHGPEKKKMTTPEPASPEALTPALPHRRSLREIVLYFLRLGTLGFGGPVALVGLMEKELVSERQWLTREEMRNAVAVSQTLPGPLAIQVGIFIAYLRGGFWGAWAGGWAFILPNFLIVAGLGALYVHFGGLSWMTAVFYGVSPAVIALILHSCYRLASRYGGLAAMGHCGRLSCRHGLAPGRGRDPLHHFWGRRHPLLWLAAARPRAAARGADGAGAARHWHEGGKFRHSRQVARFLSQSREPYFRQRSRHRALSRKGAGAADRLAQRTRVLGRGRGRHDQPRSGRHHRYLCRLSRGRFLGLARLDRRYISALVPVDPDRRSDPGPTPRQSECGRVCKGRLCRRHRHDPRRVRILLGKIAIGDWLTVLVGLGSLAVLFRFKVSNPLLIAATAVIGLIAFPLLQPGWVYVK